MLSPNARAELRVGKTDELPDVQNVVLQKIHFVVEREIAKRK